MLKMPLQRIQMQKFSKILGARAYLRPDLDSGSQNLPPHPKKISSGVDNCYLDAFLKNTSAADDIFIQSRRHIIYIGRLVVDYHPSGLSINCCGRLSAMLHDINLQQTIFN
jgi:hypothetical protein